jgi:aspartate 1-decarboxylase
LILRSVLSAKLHGVCVTRSELYYSGSIVLPGCLCEAAGLLAGDQVSVYNFDTGSRYETYVLSGPGHEVSVNGPSARLSQVGDRLVVVQYVLTDENLTPKIVFVNRGNQIVSRDEVFADDSIFELSPRAD